MKNLIKALALSLLVMGLANCGSDDGGGGGGAAPAPKEGLAGNASRIVINDGSAGGPIEWSSANSNIYFDIVMNNGRECYTGLVESADDSRYQERLSEMQSLLNASTVVNGTGDDFAFDEASMATVTISNEDGLEIYYLADPSEIPSDAQTLSNAQEIGDFYSDVLAELSSTGSYYCPGKTQQEVYD